VTSDAVAIVVAAGTGERLGAGVPKAFVPLGGVPILVRSVEAALASPAVSSVVVPAPPGHEVTARSMLRGYAVVVVTGGKTRQDSARAGMREIGEEVEIVVVHDAARPLARSALFTLVAESLADADGCVPVVAMTDTVKRVHGGWVVSTEVREELAAAQTPQAFIAVRFREAHARAEAEGRQFTDDAAVLEWAGFKVRVVAGDRSNVKITTAEDLERAEEALRRGER